MFIFVLTAGASSFAGTPPPSRLRLEGVSSPALGAEPLRVRTSPTALPFRFGWELPTGGGNLARGTSQAAYEIRVAAALPASTYAPWSSGRVASNQSQQIPYAGPLLPHDAAFTWSVRWWPSGGTSSAWSSNFSFTTGLTLPNGTVDWSGAVWIGAGSLKSQGNGIHPGGSHLRTTIKATTSNAVNNTASLLVGARLYIAGAGYYRCAIDGVRIDTHLMGPTTDFWYRLYYETYNVFHHFSNTTSGHVVLSCLLGRGRFGQMRNGIGAKTCSAGIAEGDDANEASGGIGNGNSCNPGIRAKLSLIYSNGAKTSVVSTASTWKSISSPVLSDDLFAGETYNLTLATATAGFTASPCSPTFIPDALLTNASVNGTNGFGAANRSATIHSSWMLPPIVVYNSSKAIEIWSVNASSYVVDFGVNGAGVASVDIPRTTLCASVPAGGEVKITMQYAEAIHANRTLYHHFPTSAEIGVLYVDCSSSSSSGTNVTYTPVFAQSGFRYLGVVVTAMETAMFDIMFTPTAAMFTARWVSTSFERAGTFSCGHAGLNTINEMVLRSARSNWQSIPTDCPTRERAGWLGDAHIAAETVLRNFDAGSAYRLFLQQIGESENDAGDPSDVVPFLGGHGGGGSPTWAAALPLIASYVERYYDDEYLAMELWPSLRRFVEFGRSFTKNGGCYSATDWGDWCPPGPSANTSVQCAGGNSHVSCWHYFAGVSTAARWAARVGNASDAKDYAALAMTVAEDYMKGYKSGTYGKPVQTLNGLALDLGLHNAVETAALVNVTANDVTDLHNGHLSTGIIGTKHVLSGLSLNGRADVALAMATTTSYPGWGYMASEGATSLWENWEGTRFLPGGTAKQSGSSWNHIMFGSNGAWHFEHVAGVRLPRVSPANNAPTPLLNGWKRVIVSPSLLLSPRGAEVCDEVPWASAQMTTRRGMLSSMWHCASSGGMNLTLTVPTGSTALLRLPVPAFGTTVSEVKGGGEFKVWSSGSFVPGCAGVMAGKMSVNGDAVELEVESGAYAFVVE